MTKEDFFSSEVSSVGRPLWQDWQPFQSFETREEVTTAPNILLVDDDPLFCNSFQRKARDMQLGVSVCKTLQDISSLPNEADYDVVILDYFLGDNLTALQISGFFPQETPIILISNTDGKKLSGNTWPFEVRRFIHKSEGTESILREALITCHWENLLPSSLLEEVPLQKSESLWWLPLAGVLSAATAFALLYFTSSVHSSPFYRWDKAPIPPSHSYSLNEQIAQSGKKFLP